MKSLKAMVLLAMSIATLMLFSTTLCAQEQAIRKIRFKDGTVVQGRIVQMTVDTIRITTADGRTVVRKFDEFESFIDETPVPDIEAHTFAFGLTYYHFDYKEGLEPPLKSTESGWLPGAFLSYTFSKKSSPYTRILLSYASGDLTYDGSTWTGTPLSYSDNPHAFYRFEWDVGYHIALGDKFSLIPYTGYGYRYWQRGQPNITATYTSYREIYQWHYLPVGVRADWDLSERFSLGATAAAHIMFRGRMTAQLTNVDTAYDTDPNFDLGTKVGYYGEVPLKFKLTPNWALTVAPWYEYSAIDKSDYVYVRYWISSTAYYLLQLYEPSSRTHQYGVNMSVSYSF